MFQEANRFFTELRRRKVIKVAIVYAIVAGVVAEVGSNTFGALHLPGWTLTLVLVLLILGFPIALVLAWALELTPEGLRVERAAASAPAPAAPSARVVSQLPPVRSRPLPPLPEPIDPADDAPESDPAAKKRAVLAGLRHDLRTPMNAILGYSEVLVEEAGELGIGAMVPEIQRLHAAARRVLEQIDVYAPGAADISEAEPVAIRAAAHEALVGPAAALLEQCARLSSAGEAYAQAKSDFERLHLAAQKLVAVVRALAAPGAAAAATTGGAGIERVFRRAGRGSSTGTAAALHAGTLLVVDDNPVNSDLLARQLVREGYRVFTATSGKEALEKLRQHAVDLLLLDVVMPEMDGIQVLESIQRDPALREVPVVMISALDEMGTVARCIEKGAVDYLPKPADPVLLRARVSETLRMHHLQGDLRQLEQALAESRAASAQLIRSLAPAPFRDAIERGERALCAHYTEVTAVVAKLDGLDAIAARDGPAAMLARVAEAIASFERASYARGLSIVRSTDHACTVLVGAPGSQPNHAAVAAELALDLVQAHQGGDANPADRPELRIGLHTGAALAGLVGADQLVFGLWGEAVTMAEAIAGQTPAGKIQVSAATCTKLGQDFEIASPVVIEVPGQGRMRTYPIGARKTGAPAP